MFVDYTKAKALQEQRFLNTVQEHEPVRIRADSRLWMWAMRRSERIAEALRPSSLAAKTSTSSQAT